MEKPHDMHVICHPHPTGFHPPERVLSFLRGGKWLTSLVFIAIVYHPLKTDQDLPSLVVSRGCSGGTFESPLDVARLAIECK